MSYGLRVEIEAQITIVLIGDGGNIWSPVVGLAEGVSCKTRKLSKVSTELSFKDGNRKVAVEAADHMKLMTA
jgi:hypothetical protein